MPECSKDWFSALSLQPLPGKLVTTQHLVRRVLSEQVCGGTQDCVSGKSPGISDLVGLGSHSKNHHFEAMFLRLHIRTPPLRKVLGFGHFVLFFEEQHPSISNYSLKG